MVLLELYTRKYPTRTLEEVNNGIPPSIPSDCPKSYSFIIEKCTNICPDKRPTFDQTLEWLQEVYKEVKEGDDEEEEENTEEEIQRRIQSHLVKIH